MPFSSEVSSCPEFSGLPHQSATQPPLSRSGSLLSLSEADWVEWAVLKLLSEEKDDIDFGESQPPLAGEHPVEAAVKKVAHEAVDEPPA
mmetsp:Transcript_46118/g.76225  ORF Transcript_46118/g.76225 Transcript_46118/m.76225 type:complete len:89 (+) Transcript_46118:226-492(+)